MAATDDDETDDDEVLQALEAVEAAVAANIEMNREIRRRAKQIRAARARGRSWGEITEHERRPLVVEMLRTNQERLALTGSVFRRAQAAALRREGYTLDEIARLFGVTRPRIVALLRQDGDKAAPTAPAATPEAPPIGRRRRPPARAGR